MTGEWFQFGGRPYIVQRPNLLSFQIIVIVQQHTCKNYLDAFYNCVGCDSATLSHTHITTNQVDVKSANLQGTCSQ